MIQNSTIFGGGSSGGGGIAEGFYSTKTYTINSTKTSATPNFKDALSGTIALSATLKLLTNGLPNYTGKIYAPNYSGGYDEVGSCTSNSITISTEIYVTYNFSTDITTQLDKPIYYGVLNGSYYPVLASSTINQTLTRTSTSYTSSIRYWKYTSTSQTTITPIMPFGDGNIVTSKTQTYYLLSLDATTTADKLVTISLLISGYEVTKDSTVDGVKIS